jgi:hypothetical protein
MVSSERASTSILAIIWRLHPLLQLGLTGLIGVTSYFGLRALFARGFLCDVVGYALRGLSPRLKMTSAGTVA